MTENETNNASERTKADAVKQKAKNNTPWVIAAIVVVVIALLAVLYQTGRLSGITDIVANQEAVAYVNDEKISRGELEDEFAPIREQINSIQSGAGTDREALIASTRYQVLDQLINETILLNDARSAGIEVTDEEVQQEFDNARQQVMTQQSQTQGANGEQPSFEDQLDRAGYTEREYRQELRNQLLISKYIAQNVDTSSIVATDEEIQEMYDQYASNPNIDDSQIPPLEDVRDSLEQQILQQKQQEVVNAFVEEQRAEAEVEILLEQPELPAGDSQGMPMQQAPQAPQAPETPDVPATTTTP